jgi:hypothetical protein
VKAIPADHARNLSVLSGIRAAAGYHYVMTVVDGLALHVKVLPPDTLVKMVARNARP